SPDGRGSKEGKETVRRPREFAPNGCGWMVVGAKRPALPPGETRRQKGGVGRKSRAGNRST
ncbi:MAG TPA: hypothetical protein PLU04_13625, partial [Anaerolineaceae bacterium]|nr:hypothetical protein [Anaerolineaceae bacterium]